MDDLAKRRMRDDELAEHLNLMEHVGMATAAATWTCCPACKNDELQDGKVIIRDCDEYPGMDRPRKVNAVVTTFWCAECEADITVTFGCAGGEWRAEWSYTTDLDEDDPADRVVDWVLTNKLLPSPPWPPWTTAKAEVVATSGLKEKQGHLF